MTQRYKLIIELKSDGLFGSGEGWGGVVDSDTYFDEYGLPIIPGKRIKGCLRESAQEILEMLGVDDAKINDLFGSAGSDSPSPIFISNAVINNYEDTVQWLKQADSQIKDCISADVLQSIFTVIRNQTALETDTKEDTKSPGIAKEHSLRLLRAIKKGNEFYCPIYLDSDAAKSDIYKNLLIISVSNLRRMGTNRNRGMGRVTCHLKQEKYDTELITENNINKAIESITNKGGHKS